MRSLLLLLLAAVPLSPTHAETNEAPAEAAAASNELFAVGDSVMLGAREQLLALPGWHVVVDAVVCRQAATKVAGPTSCASTSFPDGIPSGLDAIREARANGRLGQAVVLMLGSNEGVTRPQFDLMMQELADVPVVVWTTNTVRWQKRTNEMLRANIHRYPNTVLLDWARFSRSRPWFGKDRIHLNRAGRKAFATLVARTLREGARESAVERAPRPTHASSEVTRGGPL
jgi:hypothetical protein